LNSGPKAFILLNSIHKLATTLLLTFAVVQGIRNGNQEFESQRLLQTSIIDLKFISESEGAVHL
jgi:hypothetical protein